MKKDSLIVSEREVKMVEMFSNGSHSQDIADEFGLSCRTIETNVIKLKQRFCCATVAQLVAMFLRKELIK